MVPRPDYDFITSYKANRYEFAVSKMSQTNKAAIIVTKPLRCTGDELRVNADAKGGSLRVAVLDAEGFDSTDCEPVTGDVTDKEIRWKDGKSLKTLKGRVIRLRFELRQAKLFAFSGVE
jgi:hypothetical protein